MPSHDCGIGLDEDVDRMAGEGEGQPGPVSDERGERRGGAVEVRVQQFEAEFLGLSRKEGCRRYIDRSLKPEDLSVQ